MRRGERCWGAVCGRTACTVRQGAAGEALVHGDTEYAPAGKSAGLSPCDLTTNDQPAAYLTGADRRVHPCFGGALLRNSGQRPERGACALSSAPSA
jgi:hypothetical protein